ncbi:hypothetical protein BHM03_00061184 [Ensete ventricosum]|nr:hypothetical protein BHM03_00061184 [Ensete ventricosum]
MESELGQMDWSPVSYPGGRLLEWWSSVRELALARRSGQVSSRRDPSDSQVSVMVNFSIPLLRRGVGAFIVSAIDHST